MELFCSSNYLSRIGVFRGLCKRSCFYQSFWNVDFGGCFAGTGRLVCVGMQKVQGIMLIDRRIIVFRAFLFVLN